MKNYRWLLALLVLVFASLACQTVMGDGDANPTEVVIATAPPTGNTNESPDANTNDSGSGGGGGDTSNAGFPMTADATSITDMGADLLTYQTNMSADEVMEFYRDELGKAGYTERAELTVTAAGTFNIVFDGHESGKALAVQGVSFGGSTTVTVTLQDI